MRQEADGEQEPLELWPETQESASSDADSVPWASEDAHSPVRGRKRRRRRLAVALVSGAMALGGCGLFLCWVPTHTAGATASARLKKEQHRLDGLIILDETQGAEAEAVQPDAAGGLAAGLGE